LLSDLVVSLELEAELLGLLALGLALEPDAALPDVLGELAPPLAWSFLVSLDIEPEAEPEADGEDGEVDGEVVEPADDEALPEGEVVAPRGAVVLSARSHAAIIAEPKATDTASARVLNLM
jgi:hypothetical protein